MNYRVLKISGAIALAALTAPAAADRNESPPHLAIGKVAPEIEGKDVDGKKFKLSEYRGKVVVLDFWGDW
jgi:cytochrome oxidase Cu insertion factor (SCO1/SenC/PrrC family)